MSRAVAGGLLIGLIGLLAFGAQGASAGPIDIAKKQTRAKIVAGGGKVVKNQCRTRGKGRKRLVQCKWYAARLVGGKTTRNCKGTAVLKRKRGKIKFSQSSCKQDKGATGLNALIPNKLADAGYTSTYVFCFTTLGRGYTCDWEALSFKQGATENCRGSARSANKKVTLKVLGCSTNRELTGTQSGVKSALAARGLTPGQVSCVPGEPIRCTWIAYEQSGGWTYHCEGNATAPGPEGPFRVDACKLRAPELAPLTANGSPRAFGVNDAWNNPFFQGFIPRYAADFSPETARFVVSWNGSQPIPGGPILFDVGTIAAYQGMLAQGIRPILILQSAPCWAIAKPPANCNGFSSGYAPAANHLAGWRDFAAAAARAFPEAAAFEIWNEANAQIFYKGGPNSDRIDPEQYAQLLNTASAGIRSVTGSVPILTSGTAAFARNIAGVQMRYDEFLRRVYRVSGTKAASDGIAHHSYPGGGPAGNPPGDVRAQIANLKDVMIDFGDQDKPIWITEFGVSNTGDPAYTEAQQRATLVDLYQQFRRIPGIAATVIHRWRDDPSPAAYAPERGFGLTRANDTRKPAYCSLASLRTGRSPGNC